MFCDRCGARVDGPASFCPACGRSFAVPAGVPPAIPAGGRVERHVRTLGILWLVYAGFRLLGAVAVGTFASFSWGPFDHLPFFVPGLLRVVGGFLLVAGVLGALAGWGLMERRPWARMLAIVLGVLALFRFPIGTALGVYTLWVLAPAASEAEYRATQRAAY